MPPLDSDILTMRWTVMIDQPTLSDSLAPMPRFPADDSDAREFWESAGFRVQSRVDREAEWSEQHPGPRRPSVRLARLGSDIAPLLAVLERAGIMTTRGWPGIAHVDVRAALAAIAARTSSIDGMWSLPGLMRGGSSATASQATRTSLSTTGRVRSVVNAFSSLRNPEVATSSRAVGSPASEL